MTGTAGLGGEPDSPRGRHTRDDGAGQTTPTPGAARTDGLDGGSLQALRGAGPSKVGISGAMRARDVSRPNAADLELAAMRDAARTDQASGSKGSGSSPETS